MERHSEKVLKLINAAAKNLADLNDALRSVSDEQPTEKEQKDIALAMLKLTVIIKEFGK